MANILLIDAMPLIYQNFMAMKRFSTKSGIPTGLRFGFMRSMRSYTTKLNADRVGICFDLPGQVKKAEGVEEYKANREFTAEKQEMYDQIPHLREMLSLTRYAQIQAEGFEADDVIAHLARRYAAANHTVYIITPDNDLLQLVGPNVKIWMPPKSKNKAWFKDEQYSLDNFGVYPNQLLHYRSIVGDTSDNLKGLTTQSVTREKIATYIRENVEGGITVEQFVDVYLPTVLTLISPEVPDPVEVYQRNYHLMSLHDPDNLEIKKGKKDNDSLRALLQSLEMKSLVPAVGKFTGVEESGLPAEEG